MRIAFVTPEFVSESYFSGGLANYVYRVAKILIGQGHQVHVIILGKKYEDLDFEGIHLHKVGLGRACVLLNLIMFGRLRQTSEWLEFSWKVYRKLRRLHRREPLDIVQFANSRGCGLVSLLLFRVPGVTRISCYRPVWNKLADLTRCLDVRGVEWLELLQLRLCRHVYAPGVTLQRMLRDEAGIDVPRVIRTPFFVETATQDRSTYKKHLEGRNYLLFFGRLQLHKGVHILGQALPYVLSRCPDLYGVFVGLDFGSSFGPSMREYIRSLAGENSNRLVFIDQVRHDQLYPIIGGARLVVLPSLIDNFPNTCLEAMALGKPVVGTIGASFEEMLTDQKTGFLVPAGDVQVLARKITAAWNHPCLDAIGEAAKKRSEDFAPEKTVSRLIEYYEEVVAGV